MSITKVFGAVKTGFILLVFLLGCLSIVFSQFIGILFSFGNNEFLHAWLANTKASFIILLTTVVTFVSASPINIKITSSDLPSSTFKKENSKLKSILASNSVIIANHQIYIEWAFLWWLTYTSGLAGFVYIMLKDSLKKIPILGYGMKNYDFIFLSRKWINDKDTFDKHLGRVDANGRGLGPASGVVQLIGDQWPKGIRKEKTWPYSLIMFPEGTNLSANTRNKTEIYAKKVNKKPFNNVLLPKTTGLRYSLLKLKDSVEIIYDITIGYSGVKQHEYGQDIYSLSNVFLEGKNPKDVNMFIRTFKINEIPIGNLNYDNEDDEKLAVKEFEDWLFKIWKEKDELLDRFYLTGSFVNEENESNVNSINAQFKVGFFELLRVFTIPILFILILRVIYSIIIKFF